MGNTVFVFGETRDTALAGADTRFGRTGPRSDGRLRPSSEPKGERPSTALCAVSVSTYFQGSSTVNVTIPKHWENPKPSVARHQLVPVGGTAS
jgi:hypothetical protein